MKIKSITGSTWPFLKAYTYTIKHITSTFTGYLTKIHIDEVHHTLPAHTPGRNELLIDTGYTVYCFLPDSENWCLFIFFDQNEQIVEWYFDISYKTYFDTDGSPYYYDLFLDIAITSDNIVTILDEKELTDALASHVINQDTYQQAWDTCHILQTQIIPAKESYLTFILQHI